MFFMICLSRAGRLGQLANYLDLCVLVVNANIALAVVLMLIMMHLITV